MHRVGDHGTKPVCRIHVPEKDALFAGVDHHRIISCQFIFIDALSSSFPHTYTDVLALVPTIRMSRRAEGEGQVQYGSSDDTQRLSSLLR